LHGLDYKTPLLPEDFSCSFEEGISYPEMRQAAYEAIAEVNNLMERDGIPAGYLDCEWPKEDLLRLISIAPICGNQWKLMADIIPKMSIQAIRLQIEKAEEQRAARPDGENSCFILEDFRNSRGTYQNEEDIRSVIGKPATLL